MEQLNKYIHVNTPFILGTALSVLLTACGGGSDSSSSNTTDTPVTETTVETPETIEDQFSLWLNDVSNNLIIPNYLTLNESAASFSVATQEFCQLTSPEQSDLDALQSSWAALNVSWQQAQWVKVGPILESNRYFRIQLWPSDFVSRDVEIFLSSQTSLDADAVSSSSVSGQGLPALEYLLYPSESSDSLLTAVDQPKRCEVIQAISENIENITSEVYQEWIPTGGNYVNDLVEGTGEFSGISDSVDELVTNWLESIEFVKDEKMLAPLGVEAPGEPELAEYVLSDQSIASIQANITTFEGIFTANGGHGFDDILITFLDQPSISTLMSDSISEAMTTVNGLSDNYAELLNSSDGRIDVDNTIQKLRDLRDLVTIDFVQATDINIGFNSNDGD